MTNAKYSLLGEFHRPRGISESIRMVVMCGAALRSVDATDSEATLHALRIQNSSSKSGKVSMEQINLYGFAALRSL